MRKFLNLVIGGLQNKIFNVVLGALVLVTVAILLVVGIQTKKLESVVIEANEEQKKSIGDVSSGIIEDAIIQSAESTSQLQAYAVNSAFLYTAQKIQVFADLVESFLKSTVGLPFVDVPEPALSNDGVAAVRLLHAPDVDINDSAIRAKIGALGNLSTMMTATFKDGGLDSCLIGTPEGIFLIADDSSADKVGEDGKPVFMDPRTRSWYSGAVEKGGIYFSDLMKDYFTGEIGIVCSCPVYVDGKLAAVVGADIYLGTLDAWIASTYNENGFTAIINQDGHVIFAPFGQGFMSARDASEAIDLREVSNVGLADFVTSVLNGNPEAHIVNISGTEYYITGALMDTVGWAVITVVNRNAALALVPVMENAFDKISEKAGAQFYSSISYTKTNVLVVLAVVFILASASALVLGHRIVGPLGKMTKQISDLKDGDFVFKVEDIYKTKDEIEVLAKAFEDLSTRNQQYIAEVKRVTTEKERIGAELNVATHIQADMLPSIFPPYPNKTEFDLFASMKPAKEVGGDFYDFFLVDDDHLAMVIADVSGKGVPAALFMVIAKTLIKNRAQMGGTPSEILYDVNNQLCEGNRTEFFVTVWLAIIDLRTGEGLAANAGHEHPSIYREGGRFELIKYAHSPVLAAMSDIRFKEREFKLCKGDRLFVYTDGVVEATNRSNELFGEDRLLKALNSNPYASLKGVLDNVSNSINSFVGDAQQFDDITMMCIEYKGSKGTS